jgi:hypothetical protein
MGKSHHLYEISECSVRKMEVYGGVLIALIAIVIWL